MDPIVDFDDAFDDRSFVAINDLNSQFLAGYKKSKEEFDVNFLAIDRILKKGDFRLTLNKNLIKVIEIPKAELENLLKFNRTTSTALFNCRCSQEAVNNFKSYIKNKIKFKPDIIIYWETYHEILNELYPEAVFIQGSHSGLWQIEKNPDILFTIHNSKNTDTAFFDAVMKSDFDEKNHSSLINLKKEIKSIVNFETQFDRSSIESSRKFNSLVFYPGNFPSNRFKKYSQASSNSAVLSELLEILPKDCGIVYTRHPLDKTNEESSILKNERIIDLSDLAKFDRDISFRIIANVDAVVNVYSNIYLLAFLLDKPVYSFGASPNSNFSIGNIHNLANKTQRITLDEYQKLIDKTLNYVITRKISSKFLHNKRNSYLYLKHLINNNYCIPQLNTLDGYIQQFKSSRLLSNKPIAGYQTNEYESLLGQLLDPGVKNWGFDIFDTLLVRPFIKPIDLFEYIEPIAEEVVSDVSFNFKNARITAEKIAREGCLETSLDEIYKVISNITNLDTCKIDNLKQIELQTEQDLLKARYSIKNIFDLAKIHNKTVFIASDMYLPKAFILNVLQKCNYDLTDVHLFLSSDVNKVKYNGSLFKYIEKTLNINPNESIFIGDNINSDVRQPANIGFITQHYPKTTDKLFELEALQPQNLGTLLKMGLSTHMAICANQIFDNPFVSFNKKTLINNSSPLLGYMVFGPLIISVLAWLVKDISNKGYDQILFCSRDSKLVLKIYDFINEKIYGHQLPGSQYLYISRSSTFSAYCDDRYLLNIFQIYNSQLSTAEFLTSILKYDISKNPLPAKLNNKLDIRVSENINELVKWIKEEKIFTRHTDSKSLLENYLRSTITGNRVAMFDLGTRGTSRDIISSILNKQIDLYLFRETFYKWRNNIFSYLMDSFNPFRKGLRTILPQFYEQLISDANTTTCTGYINNGIGYVPEIHTSNMTTSTNLINEAQRYIYEFAINYVNTFKNNFQIINSQTRNTYIYPLSYLCANISDQDLLFQFNGNDPFWSKKEFSIIAKQSVSEQKKNVNAVNDTLPTKPERDINKAALLAKLDRFPDLYIRDSKNPDIIRVRRFLQIPLIGGFLKNLIINYAKKELTK